MRNLILTALVATSQLICSQKVALVSGSTGAIGRATVNEFVSRGWKVWAGHRKQDCTDWEECHAITPIYLDVTDDGAIANAVAQIKETDGRIDALINNAGYGLIGAAQDVTIEQMQRLFDVNFFGLLRLIQEVSPMMMEQRGGHIINISSTSGVRAIPGLGAYASSKFAVEGLTQSLAITLSPWNIAVSLVEPGSVGNQWIEHCECAKPSNPTFERLSNNLKLIIGALAQTAQSNESVAEVIVSTAENPAPDLRIQTSAAVEKTFALELIDPTGNSLRSRHLELFKTLTK